MTCFLPMDMVHCTPKEMVPMTHTLMHKDLPVADLDFDQATGSIGKIGTIHHSSHLPLGL